MTTSTGEGPQRDEARRARAIAATLGAFDPRQLLDPSNESELSALGQLATECEEVAAGREMRWMLKPDVRSRVLHEMQLEELRTLIDATPPLPDDELGRLLQGILRDGASAAVTASTDLGLLRTALRFAAPAVGERATQAAARRVDLRLSRHDADLAAQVLVPHKLIGRSKELRKLHRFATGKADVSAENILWITGVGGSGKSALLAEFARTLRGDSWSGTPVLQVDFDRPALYRGTLPTLMMEVSRQLELYFPEMEPALSTYRRAVRLGGPVDMYRRTDSFEKIQYVQAQSGSAWWQAMQSNLPITRTLVLVLDTAEEIGLSSAFDLAALRAWLRQLRTTEGLPNLRVLLSGRAFHADELALVPARQRLEVGDLSPTDATELLKLMLERKGVTSRHPLGKLVGMLGGNPLSLKILANYLAEGGDNAASELLADRTGFDKRFAQSFLYKRILGRLRTEEQDLVKLAHPGLVLRRVTPDLIRHVLAGPCGLEGVDEARSQSLLQQLADQVWLVQSTANPDVVIHRRDLRRLMLQAMSAEDAARALDIHRAAAQYYRENRDPFMTREEQACEAHYHAMFAPDADLPDEAMREAVARTLGEDIDTLPTVVRGRLKLALGRELTEDEERQIGQADLALYRSLAERKALKLTGTRRSSGASPQAAIGGDSRLLASELHSAYESGDLTAVARSASVAIRDFAESLIQGPRNDGATDLTESIVWRAALASLGRRDFVKVLLETLPAVTASPGWVTSIGSRSRGEVSGSEAYHMLFRLHGANCPAPLVSARGRSLRLYELQGLRRVQLLDPTPYGEFEVPIRLLRDLSTDLVTYSREGTEDVVFDRAAVEDLGLQQEFRAGSNGVTLNDLDRIGKRDGGLWFRSLSELPREARHLLIGRVPEVHVLVRVAARACQASVLVDFVSDASRDRLWPVELGPVALRRNLEVDRERWTATLIPVVDRFGLLRQLVDWLEDRGRLKGRSLSLVRTVRNYMLRLRRFL